MKILTVTLENRNLLKDYIDLGVNEVVLASADNTFSALHEFTGEEIKEIVEECHMHHMTVTVLMNRLYSEKDIYAAQKEMEEILHLGVDGLMFADPGLLKYAKEKHLESYLTYRPETLMTCNEDALFWKEQGLRSVVIPCLLTKDEVMDIAKYTPDTTVIIHGSTLMSVSKRKLLSAYKEVNQKDFDVRSKTLSLKEKQREAYMPAYENAVAMMIYTDYIQESFDEMHAFMDAQVTYFEIDTPFMSEKAVIDAIRIYRMLLDEKDASREIQAYRDKYQDKELSDGYYGQKTVK
jgi:putative protease